MAVGARGKRPLILLAGVIALGLSLWLVGRALDPALVARSFDAALSDPLAVAAVLSLYALAFFVRAWAWRRVLPGLPFGQALAALHVSLGANHVLPFRMGEPLRVTSVVRRARVPLAGATASTLMLRGADVLAVVVLAAALGPAVASDVVGGWGWVAVFPVAAICMAGGWWLRRLRLTQRADTRVPIVLVAIAAVVSWVLESAVIWQAAAWAGFAISPAEAVLVTAVTIAAQVVALAPGGLGTYEAAATTALVATGASPAAALAAALAAHALKTLYALVTGGLALFVPAPGAFGRLRLPRPPRDTGSGSPSSLREQTQETSASVVLFMPAHNEEASVADVVRRVPDEVCGHRVVTLVVDDGSTDVTANEASGAGAVVLSLGSNRGLGAAVRAGLERAAEMGAAAIAFCDADGEYAPEELSLLVEPILRGDADYVVGSRFEGRISRMLPHRRFGNRVLTAAVSFIARRSIGDGQSGYRAFSLAAARDAEVIHDFNYAQVLTLDLLAKGYRYAEVPISYGFRTQGSSFVRLVPYLRSVLPAIHRELNA